MRKFNVILILLFFIGLLVAYYLWDKNNSDADIKSIKDNTTEASNNVDLSKNTLSIQEKLKENKAKVSQLKHIMAGRVQAFNSNPAVDAELIQVTLEHCIKIMNPETYKSQSSYYNSPENQSDKQLKYKQDINEYCEKLNHKHPEYMLTHEDDIKVLRDSIQDDSEIGKILSKYYNDKNIELSPSDLAAKIQHLKNTDPNLLFDVASYFRPNLGEKFHNSVAEIIHSQDNMYVYMVLSSATDLYACNAGANCDRLSNMMSHYCSYRNLCGDDFNDILNNKMSEGIRLDILKVHEYMKDSFK